MCVPWLVSTDRNQAQIDRSEFVSNLFERGAVTRIACEENLLAGCFVVNDVTSPQRVEIIRGTSLRPIM